MINELKSVFGSKCSAININGEVNGFFNLPGRKMKFCEAVNYSFNIPLRITDQNLGCPGARRCIGYDNNEKKLIETIAVNNSIPESFIINALGNIPFLKNIKHINLGMTQEMEEMLKPDLYILFLKPSKITYCIHSLAKYNESPLIAPFSLLSVCGNVFASCYANQSVCISFGCPESRNSGGIEDDQAVLGIPYKLAGLLI